ncbi:hypothetical protein ETH_00025075, partial [Eimeria tenella]
QSKAALLQRLRPAGVDYTLLPACAEELQQHFEKVQALFLELHSANIRSITETMQRAAENAVGLLRQNLQQQQMELLKPLHEFKGLLLDWQQAAWTLFESEVAALREAVDLHAELSAEVAK